MATFQERIGKNGKKAYTATIRRKGVRPISKTFDRLTDAREWAARTETAAAERRNFPHREAQRTTVADLFKRYEQEVLPHLAATNKNTHRQRLDWWKARIGHLLVCDVCPGTVEKLVAELRQKPKGTRGEGTVSESTVRAYVVRLGAVLNKAVAWGILQLNPIASMEKPKQGKGRIRFLTQEEVTRLLEACKQAQNPILYPAVVLSLAGLRRGEMWKLEWSNVDLKAGTLSLLGTKNGESRGLPLPPLALAELRKLHSERSPGVAKVFPGGTGGPGGSYDPKKAFANALKRAKIDNFTWHDLRHTAASYLAMQGVPLLTIAEILGHKTLAMVKRYAHLCPEHLRSSLEASEKAMLGLK